MYIFYFSEPDTDTPFARLDGRWSDQVNITYANKVSTALYIVNGTTSQCPLEADWVTSFDILINFV